MSQDPLLRAIWAWNPKAIKALPPPTDEKDDWVRLRGRDTNTSALWEALCEIISPRKWFDRGHCVSVVEMEVLRTLVRRRPAGVNAPLSGCLHVFHTREASWAIGSARKCLHPLTAVLFLCRVLCELEQDAPDARQPRRGAVCTRILLEMGATPEGMDPILLKTAFRDRRCRKSLNVLLQEGNLCAAFPLECLSIYQQDGDAMLAAAIKKEMDRQDELALAWAMTTGLSDDVLRTIARQAFALHGMRVY